MVLEVCMATMEQQLGNLLNVDKYYGKPKELLVEDKLNEELNGYGLDLKKKKNIKKLAAAALEIRGKLIIRKKIKKEDLSMKQFYLWKKAIISEISNTTVNDNDHETINELRKFLKGVKEYQSDSRFTSYTYTLSIIMLIHAKTLLEEDLKIIV